MEKVVKKLPTLDDLMELSNEKVNSNNFMVLMNQEPKPDWVVVHPVYKNKYLPIDRIEFLLNTIFQTWKVEILSTKIEINSYTVIIRLHYVHPVSEQWLYHDGIGSCAIQVNSGANCTDISQVKSNAIMLAAPIAKSYAIKDAAEHLGKLFGRDLNRKSETNYLAMVDRFSEKTVPVLTIKNENNGTTN